MLVCYRTDTGLQDLKHFRPKLELKRLSDLNLTLYSVMFNFRVHDLEIRITFPITGSVSESIDKITTL